MEEPAKYKGVVVTMLREENKTQGGEVTHLSDRALPWLSWASNS